MRFGENGSLILFGARREDAGVGVRPERVGDVALLERRVQRGDDRRLAARVPRAPKQCLK